MPSEWFFGEEKEDMEKKENLRSEDSTKQAAIQDLLRFVETLTSEVIRQIIQQAIRYVNDNQEDEKVKNYEQLKAWKEATKAFSENEEAKKYEDILKVVMAEQKKRMLKQKEHSKISEMFKDCFTKDSLW